MMGHVTPNADETDRNVESVRQRLLSRSTVGIEKYGVTTDRAGLTSAQWLRHAQEEALDLAVYLEQLISDIAQQGMLTRNIETLERDAARYKKLRKLNPRQFGDLWERNLKEAIPFDDLVDALP